MQVHWIPESDSDQAINYPTIRPPFIIHALALRCSALQFIADIIWAAQCPTLEAVGPEQKQHCKASVPPHHLTLPACE